MKIKIVNWNRQTKPNTSTARAQYNTVWWMKQQMKWQINESKANCRQILSVIADLSAHTLYNRKICSIYNILSSAEAHRHTYTHKHNQIHLNQQNNLDIDKQKTSKCKNPEFLYGRFQNVSLLFTCTPHFARVQSHPAWQQNQLINLLLHKQIFGFISVCRKRKSNNDNGDNKQNEIVIYLKSLNLTCRYMWIM